MKFCYKMCFVLFLDEMSVTKTFHPGVVFLTWHRTEHFSVTCCLSQPENVFTHLNLFKTSLFLSETILTQIRTYFTREN